MEPERWREIDRLYQAAVDLTGAERETFLEQACHPDHELRRAVQQMLEADAKAGSFLESPAMQSVARILASEQQEGATSERLLRPKFGRYELIAPLGRGGMGEVWEARDTELDRHVALKFLAAMADFEPADDWLTREARAASALNHPNIVTVHEIFRDEGTPVLVMELVTGTTVRTLAKTPQPMERVASLGRQIAQALSAAHAHGIVHRDIKPENIIVRDDGYAKVLDFGLARHVSPDSVLRDGVVLAGTVRYMSPEQACGGPISAASDIFSLGLVLYELLTGAHPFPAKSPVEAAQAIQKNETLPPSSLNPLVPVKLDSLLLAMLTKDERSRPSAADVERVLREFEATPAEHAAHRVAARLLARPKTTGVVAVIVMAGLAYAVYHLVQKPGTYKSFGEMQITQLTHAGTVGAAAISRDGKYVAYTTEDSGAQSLWLEQLETSNNVRILPPLRQQYRGMVFSHDGTYLYYVAYPTPDAIRLTLYRIPVAGGQPTEVIAGVNSPVALSPDGKRAAFFHYEPSTGGTELVAKELDGSAEKTLASSKPPNYFDGGSAPAWSPDGKLVAAAEVHPFRGAAATILIVTEAGRLQLVIRTPFRRVDGLAWRTDGRGLLALAEELWGSRSQVWELSYPDGRARKITNDLSEYSQLSFASDSNTLVAVQQTKISNILVAPRADSSRTRQITFGTGTGGSDGFDDGLAWTPDGKIVYSSRLEAKAQIWQVNADGTGRHQLAPGKLEGSEVGACGNGDTLVFQSWRSGGADIWKWSTNDTDPQPLTSSGGAGTPDCSPDGKWVVFVSWLVGPQVLWKVPISGGKPIQLTDYQSRVPAISPNGKWIAFLDESQYPKLKIALVTASGGKPVESFSLTAGARVYRYLRWGPDGRDIDYNDDRNGVSNIWAQPISGGPPREITDFQSGHILNFAWSRTGDLALARGTSTSDAVLVKNAF